ncbi:MAG: substrate-binding domain-containing protein [Lachnospiraceae bacterium]
MKKKLAIILCLTLVLGLCGCNRQETESKKSIKIGVTLYDRYDTFISQLMDSFISYTQERESETGVVINVEIYDAAGDQTTQNSQVETMLNNGCDVICVNLVDRTEPTTIIDLAKRVNIPIVFFNRELVEEDLERWDNLYYVGAKANESGTMEGQLAAEYFKENPQADKNGDGIIQYVILEGEAGHQDSIVRTEFSIQAISNAGFEVEKLASAIANWNRAQAQTKMIQILKEYGDDTELIVANNDDMALGAIDALKAAEVPLERWPVIVGVDGTDEGLEAVSDGEMVGTVYNDKEGQAKGMVNLAYGLATQTDISYLKLEDGKYLRLPYTKVTRQDVNKYQK